MTLLSPSALVVDLSPDDLAMAADNGSDISGLELGGPMIPSLTSSFSDTLPLERYRYDPQRHERVAVSVALGQSCDLDLSNVPVFRRSPAPSPSSGRVLDISADYDLDNPIQDIAGDAVTAQSVADTEEHDYQGLLGTYSLDRWFNSTMDKTEELAVEIQHTHARSTRLEPSSHQLQASALAPQPGEHERKTNSSITFSGPDRIDPEPTRNAGENTDTNETITASKRNLQLQVYPSNNE